MRVVAWPARKNADTNPYQRLLYDAVADGGTEVNEFSPEAVVAVGRGDVLHLHWPDAYLAAGEGWRFWPRLFLLRSVLTLVSLRGGRVVWTAHNLRRATQRNGDRLDRYFWSWFLRSLDGVIFMSETSRARAVASEPDLAGVPTAVIPHGHYRPLLGAVQAPPAPTETAPLVALFFGSITSYKKVYRLLSAMAQLPEDSRVQLRVLGKPSAREPDEVFEAALARLSDVDRRRIVVRPEFIPEDELYLEIAACDLVVLPYGEVENSGSAVLALSVGRPVLGSDSSVFLALRDEVGVDWVSTFDKELTGDVLTTNLVRARRLRLHGGAPDLHAMDWDVVAGSTCDFYRLVVEGRG